MALSYKEQLKHPLWDKKRQEILERDNYKCVICGTDLHRLEIHHLCYFPDSLVWEYENELLISVCGKHHYQLTYDLPKIAGLISFQCLKNNIDLNTVVETLTKLK